MTFRAVETSAQTAFIANKNLVVRSPDGGHVIYSVSFVLLAREIRNLESLMFDVRNGTRLKDQHQLTRESSRQTFSDDLAKPG
jgi:hypothetical protein